jgi:CheY-like chemotaxis protein
MLEDTWRTVLVVDDEDEPAHAIVTSLARGGYDVVPADASSAVQLARILRPSAVILAIIPEVASRLATEIRSLEGVEDLFIVAVAGDTDVGPRTAIDRCVPIDEVADVVAAYERSRSR